VRPLLQWKCNAYYTACVCVFLALGIQHAMHMRHIVICDQPCSTIFFHIFSQRALFSKKKRVTEHKMCVLIFSTNFIWNISHCKKKWARYDKNLHWSSYKVPLVLVWFEWKVNFLGGFSENPQISYFINILPLGAQLFHADRQTDRRDEASSRFSQFCERA